MKKIMFFIFICTVLAAPAASFGNDQIGYVLLIDPDLPECAGAAWLGYLMERQVYIRDHAAQSKPTLGIAIPTFAEEVEGRKTMAQIWKELKEKNQSCKDKYLDELIPVHEANFMPEYVWTYLRREGWLEQPKDLRLEEFTQWRRLHLKEHKPETHGNIRITKKSSKSK